MSESAVWSLQTCPALGNDHDDEVPEKANLKTMQLVKY